MAVRRNRNTAPAGAGKRVARAAVAKPTDMTKVRVNSFWVDINDVKPYEFNARDNAKAIDAVAKSIETFGFIVPIVIDDEGNLAAGHTRIEAAKKLHMDEVLAIRASHLTTEQIDAFRLVDNKVSELADWDTDLLGQEFARLQQAMGDAIDFTQFGWSQAEIDCLSSVVAADCLSASDLLPATATDEAEGNHITERRAPTNTRFVLGEFVFFTPATTYRNWIDGLRRLHNFNEADMIADVKNRLGILE